MPYFTLNDVNIYYRLDGDPRAPVLLLLNAMGTSLEMWQPQIQHLSEHFNVLRCDSRGHGWSSVTPGPYSIAQLGGDIIDLLDHLGIARAHVCGSSMGGMTAMWLALHHPQRVHGLILSNTAAYIGPPGSWNARVAAVERGGMEAIAAAVVARWFTLDYALLRTEQIGGLVSMFSATPAAGYAASCMAVRECDLRADVAGIDAPTLVICGSGDLWTPPADGHFLHHQIVGSRYLELDAGHLANQQQPARFGRAVAEFLQAL